MREPYWTTSKIIQLPYLHESDEEEESISCPSDLFVQEARQECEDPVFSRAEERKSNHLSLNVLFSPLVTCFIMSTYTLRALIWISSTQVSQKKRTRRCFGNGKQPPELANA